MNDQSGHFWMPFGKYKGRTLDVIAQTDDGLRYLDWLLGEIDPGTVKSALESYLGSAEMQAEIQRILK